jgi:hypothetical protein
VPFIGRGGSSPPSDTSFPHQMWYLFTTMLVLVSLDGDSCYGEQTVSERDRWNDFGLGFDCPGLVVTDDDHVSDLEVRADGRRVGGGTRGEVEQDSTGPDDRSTRWSSRM